VASISRAGFKRRLWSLSRSDFAAFVADLWAARGWETRIEDGVVVAVNGDVAEHVIVVRHGRSWSRFLPGQGVGRDDATAVVTSGRGAGRAAGLARSLGADLHTADDLYDQLAYALDGDARQRLVETYVAGRPPVWVSLVSRALAVSADGVRDTLRALRERLQPSRAAVAAMVAVGAVWLLVVGAFVAPDVLDGTLGGGETPPVDSDGTPPTSRTTTAPPTATVVGPSEPWIGTGSDAWRMFRGGPAHTGWRPNATTPDGGTVHATFEAGETVVGSLTVVNGTVYVGTTYRFRDPPARSALYALDAATLRPRWEWPVEGSVTSSPAVGGAVYTGSIRWQLRGPGLAQAATSVHAVEADRPRRQWGRQTQSVEVAAPGLAATSSPTLLNGTLYIGGVDGGIHALNTSGAKRWTVRTGGSVFASPTAADGTVYVGSTDGTVYALATADGSTEWTFETDGAFIASTAAVDRRVYAVSAGGTLYALDAETGRPAWTRSFDGAALAAPAVADETVYLGRRSGRVDALDAADGSTRWRATTNGSVLSSPVVADGTVYVGSNDGRVYAFGAATGATRWRVHTDGEVQSSPAVTDGVVYVGTTNGTVYAIGEPTRDG
jgi:outer membrane protein assembly factor BamB